jgi:hypothetical protein
MRRFLRLLLHCPPGIVLQTLKVMTILTGDFASRLRDEGARTEAFMTQVVMRIPDAILTVDSNGLAVTYQNTATERLFGPQMIDENVNTAFRSVKWSGPVDHL